MTTDIPILEAPIRKWRCAACGLMDQTQKAEPHTQMHPCPATGGLNIPLVEVDSHDIVPDARHVPVLGDQGQIVAVRTEHGSGRIDCTVFT